MMSAKYVVIVLVFGIVMLALGGFLGIVYESQAGSGVNQLLTTPTVVKELSSKVVPSIAAYGIISNINGRNLTLSAQGDSIMVAVASDAQVYSFVSSSGGAVDKNNAVSKQITFADIKNGDNVTVNLKVLPNGQLAGTSVIILPPALSPVTK